MSNHIEIRFDARRLSPDQFLEGAKQFFILVEGVSKNIIGSSCRWAVEVDKGSAILRMQTDDPVVESRKAVDIICQGVRSIRNGLRAYPAGFTKREVEALKSIASLNSNDVQSISIKNGREPEAIPFSVVTVANDILVRQSDDAFGSVEGKIVSLSSKHGLVCVIYDRIERREITCYILNQDLKHITVVGFETEVCVLAYGLIHYSKEGEAVNISVDSMELFPPDSELPTLGEIQEIYRSYK